ncbi:MAG: hypothetical protein R2831_07815 [Chitinophagaceae bacterium]
MQKHIYFSILLLFSVFYTSTAQKVVSSNPIPFNISKDDFVIIGLWHNNPLVFIQQEKQYELYSFSKQLSTIEKIPFPNQDGHIVQLDFIVLDNIIYAFYEVEKKKIYTFYTRKYENNIWSTPNTIIQKDASEINKPIFNIVHSKNKMHHLLTLLYKENHKQNIDVVVFDNRFSASLSLHHEMSKENAFLNKEMAVSNIGIPYLLVTDVPSYKDNLVEEIFWLSPNESKSEMILFPISLSNHTIHDFHISIDEIQQILYLTSWYGDGKFHDSKGIFISTCDLQLTQTPSKHFMQIRKNNFGEKADMDDLNIRNISIKNNASIEIIAERVYQNNRTISGYNPNLDINMMSMNQNVRNVSEYYFDDIFIFNIKPDFTISWTQNVMKEQLSIDDYGLYSSFCILENEKGKIFFFNDVNKHNERTFVSYVNSLGDYSMSEVPKTEALTRLNILTKAAKQLDKASLLFPAFNVNMLQFILVDYHN